MSEVTNLERAMWAETALHDYSNNKEGDTGGDLYDAAESVIRDLITDLCHLLHLDEKTAGCKTPEAIEILLSSCFFNFEEELAEEVRCAKSL